LDIIAEKLAHFKWLKKSGPDFTNAGAAYRLFLAASPIRGESHVSTVDLSSLSSRLDAEISARVGDECMPGMSGYSGSWRPRAGGRTLARFGPAIVTASTGSANFAGRRRGRYALAVLRR
jgi:hypothetical protein